MILVNLLLHSRYYHIGMLGWQRDGEKARILPLPALLIMLTKKRWHWESPLGLPFPLWFLVRSAWPCLSQACESPWSQWHFSWSVSSWVSVWQGEDLHCDPAPTWDKVLYHPKWCDPFPEHHPFPYFSLGQAVWNNVIQFSRIDICIWCSANIYILPLWFFSQPMWIVLQYKTNMPSLRKMGHWMWNQARQLWIMAGEAEDNLLTHFLEASWRGCLVKGSGPFPETLMGTKQSNEKNIAHSMFINNTF